MTFSNSNLLLQLWQYSLLSNELFLWYKKPQVAHSTLVLGSAEMTDFSDMCITLAPFVQTAQSPLRHFFVKKQHIFHHHTLSLSLGENMLWQKHFSPCPAIYQADATSYEAMIAQAVQNIQGGDFSKIVLSRTLSQNLPTDFHPLAIAQQLMNHYPKAFVYVLYQHNIGCWIGASPELLLEQQQQQIQSVALAGTRSLDKKDAWGAKEMAEHVFVSDFVKETLAQQGVKNIRQEGPIVVEAGRVAHLKTFLQGEISASSSFATIAAALHPTPAVAGIPKEEAIRYIRAVEKYSRAYYTGYIAIENETPNTAFAYVNLRCMQVFADKALLYVGGGITADSDPKAEWQETVHKSKTLLEFLE
ncbi:MAG: chorismate-binding protein [Chitinophagales bacterium]|nr:chorismate-binding protein [Bacteroidota bacterium]